MSEPKGPLKELVDKALKENKSSSWFEPLYEQAAGDAEAVPWARLEPHPELIDFLKQQSKPQDNRKALVIGCGLGDDAEELAQRGYQVTAFDISPRAIQWAQERFPKSSVHYQVADLFAPPSAWHQYFDLVVEIYTVQALPLAIRKQAIQQVANFVATDGRLLLVCHGRPDEETDPAGPPWPISKQELSSFAAAGLTEVSMRENTETGTETLVYYQLLYQRD